VGRTIVTIRGGKFFINGAPTYSDLLGARPETLGLLWNQRMIQGIFDDAAGRSRYDQLTMEHFDPEANTDALIEALPAWYAYGLRAITVGFQGGWPVTMFADASDMETIENNPFGQDGDALDPAYAARMERVIRAADELGMVVIVNIFYWAQAARLRDGKAITAALHRACAFLREHAYTNVIIDLANEYNIRLFDKHPLIHSQEGMAHLIGLVREWSGMPVGASVADGAVHPQVIAAGDFVLIHGNAMSRGEFHNYALKVLAAAGGKPVVCNEDSPCFSRVDVALEAGVSWGYYNNYTKQLPPCAWQITPGEDLFFARRMARAVGIPVAPLPPNEQLYLQGLEGWNSFGGGLRVLRLAAEYPERVDHVCFYCNGRKMDTAYDEPFFLYMDCTWLARPILLSPGDRWTARVTMTDGNEYTLAAQA